MGLALATLAGVTVLVALVSEIFVESVQGAALEMGMTPAFVGFVVVALVGGAAEMASAFSGARKNRLDLSVGIALGSASQIALFVAPVLVLISYVLGPTPMDLQFWPGAVVMMLIATMTATMLTSGGRSTWFVGTLLLMVYAVFAMTLYLLPPRVHVTRPRVRIGADRMLTTPISQGAPAPSRRALDPVDRVAEVLFGLIMVLTFTGSLSVAEAGRDDVRAMLDRRAGVQPGLGHHRRHPVPHGLPGRAEPAVDDVPGRARRRQPGAGAGRSSRTRCRRSIASILAPGELDAMRARLVAPARAAGARAA